MKKLLSIFLATAMLISLIPAAFASDTEAEKGIKVVYDFTNELISENKMTSYQYTSKGEIQTGYKMQGTTLNYDSTSGFWEYMCNSNDDDQLQTTTSYIRPYPAGNCLRATVYGRAHIETEKAAWIAFSIYVPKTGVYDLDIKVNYRNKTQPYVSAYIFKSASVSSVDGKLIDQVKAGLTEPNVLSTGKVDKTINNEETLSLGEDVKLDEGEHYFVYNPISPVENFGVSSYMDLLSLTLTEGDGTKSVPIISSLTADENQVTATAAKMSNGDTATDVTYSYAVAADDAALAEVDANTGVVTGKADGTATIIATATKDGLSSSKSIEVKVTAPVVEPVVTPDYEEAFGEDTYEIEENVNVNPDVKVVAYANGEKLSQETTSATKTGDVYEVKTDATIGDYTFRYWARGLENAEKGNKRIVSLENNFTYSAEKGDANWLIAVYTKDGEDAETEYFNANGQLIPDATDATRPYMLGYGYATDWKDNGNGIKEAVYGNGVQSYNITVNGKSDLYKYGAKIVCPTVEVPENKYFWGWTKKVGNAAAELVSTETNYTFYAWEACVVEPMFGDSELVRGDIIARKILISKLDIGNNESVIKAEFIGFGDAVERGITLGAKDYAMTRDDATQFAIINNVNATQISAYAILEGGTKYIYTYVAPTAE